MASDNLLLTASFVSGAAYALDPVSDFEDIPVNATIDVVAHGLISMVTTKYLLSLVDAKSNCRRNVFLYALTASAIYFTYDAFSEKN